MSYKCICHHHLSKIFFNALNFFSVQAFQWSKYYGHRIRKNNFLYVVDSGKSGIGHRLISQFIYYSEEYWYIINYMISWQIFHWISNNCNKILNYVLCISDVEMLTCLTMQCFTHRTLNYFNISFIYLALNFFSLSLIHLTLN
jgi:hypothetical protein